jgi:hypothetical protein
VYVTLVPPAGPCAPWGPTEATATVLATCCTLETLPGFSTTTVCAWEDTVDTAGLVTRTTVRVLPLLTMTGISGSPSLAL